MSPPLIQQPMGTAFGMCILHSFQSVWPPHGQWPAQLAAGEYIILRESTDASVQMCEEIFKII